MHKYIQALGRVVSNLSKVESQTRQRSRAKLAGQFIVVNAHNAHIVGNVQPYSLGRQYGPTCQFIGFGNQRQGHLMLGSHSAIDAINVSVSPRRFMR